MVFGFYGVNIMEFCKVYNVQIEGQCGNIVLVEIIIYEDCMFSFVFKILLVVEFIKKVVGIKKGMENLVIYKVGKIFKDQVCEIVEIKMLDFNVNDIEVVMKIVVGIVWFMGVEVEV